MSVVDISTNFGALLIGAFFTSVFVSLLRLVACCLTPLPDWRGSAIFRPCVTIGTMERIPRKLRPWLLDNVHTGFIWGGLWYYLIGNYGEPDKIDRIPWHVYGSSVSEPEGLKLIVLLTALITILVHCFLARRIFLLSNKNWFMTTPVLVLTLFRLAVHVVSRFLASLTSESTCRQKSYDIENAYMAIFRPTTTDYVKWIFTLGLAVSSAVDVLIAGLLVYLFRSNRTGSGRFNHVLDKLILYGLESGSLTWQYLHFFCTQWVLIPQNMIFLGLYFIIAKLSIPGRVPFPHKRSVRVRQEIQSCFWNHREKEVLRDHILHVLILNLRPSANISQHATPSSKVPTELQVAVQTQRDIHYDTNSISSST
ncbi:hypothetical protein B0H13DRAFT_1885890 [Mycena leptocephala]|nr:hypothetical protein B0H13DRAFT_1885890 [Mycena leptocephala]